MGAFSEYPYQNYSDMNLDWIIRKIKEFQGTLDDFIHNHPAISYADPLNWNISLQYEANMVVLGPDGDSYLSVKIVPAGIQLNNGEYWLKIGLFNTQLYNLKTEVESANFDINHFQYLLIGDSYTIVPSVTDNWANALITKLGNPSHEIMRRDGGGFGNGAFLSALNAATLPSNKPTVIIVCGGFNDVSYIGNGASATDLYNSISSFITAAKTKYPNSRIKIGFIAYETNSIAVDRNNLTAWYKAMNVYRQVSDLNVDYLHGVEYALRKYEFLDNTYFHPTSNGVIALKDSIYSALRTGYAYDTEYFKTISSSECTPAVTGETISSLTFDQMNGSRGASCEINFYVEFATPITLRDTNILTVNDTSGLFRGSSHLNATTPFIYTLQGDTNLYYGIGKLTYVGNVLHLWSEQQISNVNGILISTKIHMQASSDFAFLEGVDF